MKYLIKQIIITKLEIELPDGSIPVQIKHHNKYTLDGQEYPECWQVVWLEPNAGDKM